MLCLQSSTKGEANAIWETGAGDKDGSFRRLSYLKSQECELATRSPGRQKSPEHRDRQGAVACARESGSLNQEYPKGQIAKTEITSASPPTCLLIGIESRAGLLSSESLMLDEHYALKSLQSTPSRLSLS